MALLGELMHWSPVELDTEISHRYCESLTRRDFSEPCLLYTFLAKKGSLFTSLDQCPQTLLNDLTAGGVQGVYAHMRMCQDGLPSIS